MSESLSRTERLILLNQLRILRALEPKERNYDELEEIVCDGYEVFYSELFNAIFEPMPADEGRFVLDVLTMYEMLGLYIRDNPEDEEVAGHRWATFRGFDGNNETELYGFSRFLIEKQGKFESVVAESKSNGLNSHTRTGHVYAQMLTTWKTDKGPSVFGEALDHDAAMAILNAATG